MAWTYEVHNENFLMIISNRKCQFVLNLLFWTTSRVWPVSVHKLSLHLPVCIKFTLKVMLLKKLGCFIAKKLAPDTLILLFLPNNFHKATVTSNKMPAVRITTDRWAWLWRKKFPKFQGYSRDSEIQRDWSRK